MQHPTFGQLWDYLLKTPVVKQLEKKSTKNSGKNQIYYLSRISNFNADRKYETVFSESY
jgi:hypothetical protein